MSVVVVLLLPVHRCRLPAQNASALGGRRCSEAGTALLLLVLLRLLVLLPLSLLLVLPVSISAAAIAAGLRVHAGGPRMP